MSDLRITDTNSANDSKGRAFGLEGNDFIFVLIAFVVGLAFNLVLFFVLRAGLIISILLSAPFFLGTTAYVVWFRHNKPEGYAEDFFDDLIDGEGWSLTSKAQPAPKERKPHG